MSLFHRRPKLQPAVEPPVGPVSKPLVVRIRSDHQVELNSRWPAEHQFSRDWLDRFADTVKYDDQSIEIRFSNARAKYAIAEWSERGDWAHGVLVDSSIKERT